MYQNATFLNLKKASYERSTSLLIFFFKASIFLILSSIKNINVKFLMKIFEDKSRPILAAVIPRFKFYCVLSSLFQPIEG